MLAPEIEEELREVEIVASRRIRSMRFGESRSPLKGTGYDLEAHSKYTIGEDLRRVDWNVSARMQDLYIKRQFEEKEVTVFLAVDVSRSMNFSTAHYSKRLRVLQVAATLGFSAVSDNCNFGFMAFSDQIEAFERPRMGRAHVWGAIEQLYNLQPKSRGTDWGKALVFLRSRLRRMAMIFLLSDFIADPELDSLTDMPDLKVLARKHDVVPIIFGDQLENNLPSGHGLLRFRSPESGQEMVLNLSSAKRRHYAALVEERRSELRDLFYPLGMECLFLEVREPFLDPLMLLFERRRKV
ncbi:MAG: DUF58 domain-containing protein [Acidobacteria bacterium]|nr:DUF58 domain-containing protein [Acidobacteriota bacterium]